MSSIRLPCFAAMAVLLVSPAGAQQTVSCPASLGAHPSTSQDLYDGPPKNLASLVPEDDGWLHLYPRGPGDRELILVCRYGAGRQVVVHVPPTATNCLFGNEGQPEVTCR